MSLYPAKEYELSTHAASINGGSRGSLYHALPSQSDGAVELSGASTNSSGGRLYPLLPKRNYSQSQGYETMPSAPPEYIPQAPTAPLLAEFNGDFSDISPRAGGDDFELASVTNDGHFRAPERRRSGDGKASVASSILQKLPKLPRASRETDSDVHEVLASEQEFKKPSELERSSEKLKQREVAMPPPAQKPFVTAGHGPGTETQLIYQDNSHTYNTGTRNAPSLYADTSTSSVLYKKPQDTTRSSVYDTSSMSDCYKSAYSRKF